MFTFPVDVQELFDERARQFMSWGVPRSAVLAARTGIRDMWSEEPDGWTPVWARRAERAESRGKWLLAARYWGAARFPCLATPARRHAYERQLAAYARASARFPVHFERLELDVPYVAGPDDGQGDGRRDGERAGQGDARRGGGTPVPVHLFRRRLGRPCGLLVLCGGVDTWKVELHRLAVLITRLSGLAVGTVDMPGTGESRLSLSPTSDLVLAGALERLRERYPVARTGFFGISFGGHFAAKLALTRRVDAAVDLGGPIGAGEHLLDATALPNGMTGIVGNALGLNRLPDSAEATALQDGFSLRRQGLLDGPKGAPLLAVNGADDAYIPRADTTVFARRPEATVWVVRGATHCAAERIARVVPAAVGWLMARLNDGRPGYRAVEAVSGIPLVRLRGAVETDLH